MHGVPASTGRRIAARFWARKGRVRRILLSLVAVFVLLGAWSIGGALLRPGTDPASARLAEWARDHGLGPAVSWLENQQYQQHPPQVGGTLSPAQRDQLTAGSAVPPVGDRPAAIPPLVTQIG